jgi:predicted RNA binding protein YcfA (HicA-like mRNA interferase family)
MSKLPIISSKDMVKILILLDFSEIRQNGSHKIYKHEDGRTVIIPFHGEDIGRGLLRKILNEIEISIDEYIVLKKKI